MKKVTNAKTDRKIEIAFGIASSVAGLALIAATIFQYTSI